MKYILLVTVFLLGISSSAQDCTNESLIQTKGILIPDEPAGGREFIAADLAKHKKVLATIINMVKSKYTPMGLKALYHENYGYPITYMPANGYAYSIIPLNFYCDGNTIKINVKSSTYFSITANYFNAIIYESPNNEEAASGTGFNYIPDMPIEKDGYYYFNKITDGIGSAWLITYDGKLPFAYVTKKEFLETQKLILPNSMTGLASHFKNGLKNIEIEKKFKEAEFKNDPEKLKKYMKMDYLPIKENCEKQLADNEKKFKPAFDKIEEQLKLPADELNKQAIVKMDPYDHLSFLFTDDSDAFGQVLIKPNPAYFKKLPKSSPQFFGVYVRGNPNEPIAAKFMTDIMKAVDFATLKDMLGK